MRMPKLAGLAVLFTVFAVPAALRAQFQPPSDEELKMTAEPTAPGAAALYLYREAITDDETHTISIYQRIKILTEKGKEIATFHFPYVHGVDVVSDIHGRTIHSDGQIVQLDATATDLMSLKAKDFQINEVVFTLPSAEVGSILEFRLKITVPMFKISEPVWDIQSSYPIRQEHFSFHTFVQSGYYVRGRDGEPLDRLMTSERLPAGAVVQYDKSKNSFALDLVNVAAMPDEDWTPPLNTVRWRVEFYHTNAKSPTQFWADAGKEWAQTVTDFIHPTGTLKNAASQLVSPTDSEDQKARKIYAAVQKIDNTDFSRKKSDAERKKEKIKEIHKAEDVWKQQSGTQDEITLLYVALARAAGLNAWPLQVVNRDRAMFDAHYFSDSQLDDYIAGVQVDGKDVYLDPGQKLCAYGTLHWKHTLAGGFDLNGKSVTGAITPAYSFKAAIVLRTADLTVDASGNVTGSMRINLIGPDALHWRQLALENDESEVRKQFVESVQSILPDGIQVDFDHFAGLDNYNTDLIAIARVSGNLGAVTGKHLFLPDFFFESRAKHPFVNEDKRVTPVDVQFGKTEQDQVTYHLPPGFSVEGAPQVTANTWPDHALFKIGSQITRDGVSITRTLAYNFTVVDPKDYQTLHDFYQKVATADQQQLVLARTASAQGN